MIIKAALGHAAIFAGLSGALVLGFALLPGLGIAWYPEVIVPFVAISPIFFGAITARRLLARLGRMMTGRERLVLAATLGVAVGGVAILAEAAMAARLMSMGFLEVLIQPPSDRYALVGSVGLSFAATATLAAGFAGLVNIPARLRVAVMRAQQDPATGP